MTKAIRWTEEQLRDWRTRPKALQASLSGATDVLTGRQSLVPEIDNPFPMRGMYRSPVEAPSGTQAVRMAVDTNPPPSVPPEACRRVLELSLPYPPSGNRSARHTRTGVHYTPASVVAYRKAVRAATIGFVAFVGPFALDFVLHPKLTAKGKAPRRRLDLDNVLKCLLDALQHAGMIEDDRGLLRLTGEIGEPRKGGAVSVRVSEA